MERITSGNINTKQPNGGNGWFFGTMPDVTLPYPWRYGGMQMKWAELKENAESDGVKPAGSTTIAILISGGPHEITLYDNTGNKEIHTLSNVGDFVTWGPEIKHSWKAVKANTTITFRWGEDKVA